MKNFLFVLTGLVISNSVFAQVDFNEYKTISSSGILPDDFRAETYEKVREEMDEHRDGMTQIEQQRFLESTHYAIDDLLHSGFVVFGDPISTYVTEIADKLLADDPTTRATLRFYTLKTNEVNAFSTDQGIIFVTTGLMSHVSNEAQLAFILAHEICHFQEKHVVESFTLSQNRSRNWVSKMSVYSRDHEFEADRLAVKLYHNAGYSKEALKSTFDVLKYSHLPFDELDIPKSYFRTENIFIPDSHFPSKAYKINIEEDQDDSESSHPNIKRRREAANLEIAKIEDWQSTDFILEENRFEEVRNIARFESARVAVIEYDYGDALYMIYLLERDFPASIYLQQLKAKILLGLYQFEVKGKTNTTLNKISEYEGSSATFHYLLRKLNKESMAPLALRYIYDIKQVYPNDEEVEAIYSRFIHELAWTKEFDISEFSTQTFKEATAPEIKEDLTIISNDSTNLGDTPISESNDKDFDSTEFYLYMISDIVVQADFLERFATERKEFDLDEELDKEFAQLSYKERKKIFKEEGLSSLHIGAKELICVEPKVYSYTKHGVDQEKSEKLELRFSNALDDASKESGLTVYPIDSRSIQMKGTQGFNERSTLITLLYQIGTEVDIESFPVDFRELKDISHNYGSANVMFSMVEHYYDANINWIQMGMLLFIPPLFAVMSTTLVPAAIIQGNKTSLSMLVLDVETGSIVTGNTYEFNEPIRKYHLGAHLYDILMNLKTEK